MRWLALLFFLAAGPALAQVPPLEALAGFSGGGWTMSPIGGGPAQKLCLADAQQMLTGGRRAADCRFTVIEDSAMASVVNFRCKPMLSGRTSIRRDAGGLYTVHTQGVANGLPFVVRSEWRHGGDCGAGSSGGR